MLARIILIMAVLALVIYVGIYSVKKRRQALLGAENLLKSLRGENDILQSVLPEIRVGMLLAACEDAGVTLKTIGTSGEELARLCREYEERLKK